MPHPVASQRANVFDGLARTGTLTPAAGPARALQVSFDTVPRPRFEVAVREAAAAGLRSGPLAHPAPARKSPTADETRARQRQPVLAMFPEKIPLPPTTARWRPRWRGVPVCQFRVSLLARPRTAPRAPGSPLQASRVASWDRR